MEDVEDDIIGSVIMNDVLNHLRSGPNDYANFLDGDSNDGFQFKKEFRKNEHKIQQELYKSNIEKYNKRIDQIQKQKVINNSKKAEEICKKKERMKNVIFDLKNREVSKRIELLKSIKEKEKKSQNLIVQRKNEKIQEKRNSDIVRYIDKVNCQNRSIAQNRFLMKKCLEKDNEVFSVEEKIVDEQIEQILEEECVIDSDQSVRKLFRNSLSYLQNMFINNCSYRN